MLLASCYSLVGARRVVSATSTAATVRRTESMCKYARARAGIFSLFPFAFVGLVRLVRMRCSSRARTRVSKEGGGGGGSHLNSAARCGKRRAVARCGVAELNRQIGGVRVRACACVCV